MLINKNENLTLRQKTISFIWPVAATFFIAYIFVSFFITKDFITGWLLLPNFLAFIVIMITYFKTKNVWLVGNILATLGMPVILPWIITGGPAGVGLWWSVVYVVWAFIVTDNKPAIFWLSTHLIISVTLVILSLYGFVKIAYPIPVLLNILFAYIITILYVFFLVKVLEHYIQLSTKRAEELEKLNKELEIANKELEQYSYVASHDLQEPLRTVSNFVGLIEKKYPEKMSEETEKYFKFIKQATSRMQNLIKDLLDFSKSGKNITFDLIDCNRILLDVIAEMDASITESQAKISSTNLPILRGNEIELKRLFQNLISNAIKYRKENINPEISISVENKKSEYLFEIKDNGIGIEKQYISKLFVIFQRLHNASEYPGTGIGLATCLKIVTLHKGKIWVTSKFGEGSTFYFTLSKNI